MLLAKCPIPSHEAAEAAGAVDARASYPHRGTTQGQDCGRARLCRDAVETSLLRVLIGEFEFVEELCPTDWQDFAVTLGKSLP